MIRISILTFALLTPLTFASAKSITIEVSDEVSYKSLQTYEDGMTFVENPKLYNHNLGAATIGGSQANVQVFCQKLGMTGIDYRSRAVDSYVDIVNYDIGEDGKVLGPYFTSKNLFLGRVICKR